jgi:hypothetical protein
MIFMFGYMVPARICCCVLRQRQCILTQGWPVPWSEHHETGVQAGICDCKLHGGMLTIKSGITQPYACHKVW